MQYVSTVIALPSSLYHHRRCRCGVCPNVCQCTHHSSSSGILFRSQCQRNCIINSFFSTTSTTTEETMVKSQTSNPQKGLLQSKSSAVTAELMSCSASRAHRRKSANNGCRNTMLHKPVKTRFKRRCVVMGGRNQQWHADLVDMSNLKRQDDGTTFLLTVIDVFSKQVRCAPLKNKSAPSLVAAFNELLVDVVPTTLQIDKGLEFLNRLC